MADLDIVGSAGVDVVPVVPQFHTRLKAAVLPIADRVGEEVGRRMGDAISRNIVIAIPDAVTQGAARARVVATREGGRVGGAFGRSVKAKLEEAFRSLPRADVRINDTGLNAQVDRIRSRIQTLSGKTIGIDIDAGAALAEITDISARLERLAAEHPTVQVRTDTAAARAALAEVQRAINDLDHDDVNIRVKTNAGSAISELRALGTAIVAVAALPAVPVAAAGIGSLAATAVAAGAGVGALALVAVPAFKAITGAMQAQTAAQNESARATDNSAASSVRAAQNALQLAGAEASLTSARRQASQAIQQANAQVATAERSLSDAQKSARQAQEDLTTARKDAAEQLRSLNDQLLDGKLSERQAALDVAQAQEDLNKVLADPTATDLQRQQAQLAFDEAQRNAQKTKQSNEDLQKQVVAANKAGVDGTDEVKQAKQRLADANSKIGDQERALADARQKVRDAQIQGAEQVAAAERNLQSVQLSGVDTTAKTVTAADTYRQALAKLTPEQRALYDSIAGPKGLKNAYSDWSTSLQPEVLPLFTRGVNAARNALPGFTPLVKSAASAVGVLFDKASREMKTPFWGNFRKDLTGAVKPAIVGVGTAFGNVFKGIAGVLDAFLPHTETISERLIKTTSRFSKWGQNLKANPAFAKFLGFSADRGAVLADVFGKVAVAILDIGEALTPVSGPLLKVVGGVADTLGSVATYLPELVVGIYALFLGTKLWAVAQWGVNAAMEVFDLISKAGPWGWIILGITAVVAGLVYAYRRFSWFRDAVNAVWNAIKVSAVWLWDTWLKPIFTNLWDTIAWLGAKVLWFHEHAVAPAFRAIGAVAKWLYEHALKPQLSAIWTDVNWLGQKFGWLWTHAISPSIDNIADGAKWLYRVGVKPAFDNLRSAIGLVADSFGDAKNAIKKHWDGIASATARPVNFVIDMVYTRGIKAIWDEVAHFVGLKSLPKAPKLLDETPRFAEGGRTSGGTPGVDSIPILAMADEYIIRRSSARKLGFGTLDYINRTGELPRFAGGGIVGALGSAFDWTKSAVGKAVDWTSTAASLVAHPTKVWGKLVQPILDAVAQGVGNAPMGKALAKFPVKMADGLRDMIVDAVTGSAGNSDIGGSIPSGQRRSIITQALAAAHIPPPGSLAQWLAGFNTLITRESGWNPSAINLWDSNAKAGHPSQGLTQTIPSTFYAYVPASLRGRGILDPVANVAASARYIKAVYGSITNVQQANARLAPKGYADGGLVVPNLYDSGGYLPPGLSLVANGTGSPEPVLTSKQFADIRAAKSGAGVDPSGINVYVSTTLDGRELTGHVDKRIERWERETADAINYKRNV
ncbi:transglycosylase SLT domain-containing protein [Streptomyces humi]